MIKRIWTFSCHTSHDFNLNKSVLGFISVQQQKTKRKTVKDLWSTRWTKNYEVLSSNFSKDKNTVDDYFWYIILIIGGKYITNIM